MTLQVIRVLAKDADSGRVFVDEFFPQDPSMASICKYGFTLDVKPKFFSRWASVEVSIEFDPSLVTQQWLAEQGILVEKEED